MAYGQRFSKKRPGYRQKIAEYGRVATVDIGGQGRPMQSVLIKEMGVFTPQLHGVPKKWIVLHQGSRSCQAGKNEEES